MALRVGVIGAGASGLAALRHLLKKPDIFQPLAFEKLSGVGGLWIYTDVDDQRLEDRTIHSSIYKNMTTNLPKEVMAFPDFPFDDKPPSFLGHEDVRKYLGDYAQHFGLTNYIKFNSRVENVQPVIGEGGKQSWVVEVTDLVCQKKTEYHFDAVMVCNGHYADPYIPEIPGIESFEGTVMHSHLYREPKYFADKRVCVLGVGPSGKDIGMEISSCAAKVWICHRKDLDKSVPKVIIQAPGIKQMTRTSAVLDNGDVIDIDTLIFCTGYRYSFPFLSPECRVVLTRDNHVKTLYKDIINVNFPSMAFIGIPGVVCPFPLFHCQVQFFLASLSGKMILPTKDEMEADVRAWRESQGIPAQYFHRLGPLQWSYNSILADLAGFEPISKGVVDLYEHVHTERLQCYSSYKMKNYKLSDDNCGFIEC